MEVSEKRLLEVLEKRLQRIARIAEFLRIGGEKVEISRNLTEEKAKVSFIWDLGFCGDTKEFERMMAGAQPVREFHCERSRPGGRWATCCEGDSVQAREAQSNDQT